MDKKATQQVKFKEQMEEVKIITNEIQIKKNNYEPTTSILKKEEICEKDKHKLEEVKEYVIIKKNVNMINI